MKKKTKQDNWYIAAVKRGFWIYMDLLALWSLVFGALLALGILFGALDTL